MIAVVYPEKRKESRVSRSTIWEVRVVSAGRVLEYKTRPQLRNNSNCIATNTFTTESLTDFGVKMYHPTHSFVILALLRGIHAQVEVRLFPTGDSYCSTSYIHCTNLPPGYCCASTDDGHSAYGSAQVFGLQAGQVVGQDSLPTSFKRLIATTRLEYITPTAAAPAAHQLARQPAGKIAA
jgi:hypothetical protein